MASITGFNTNAIFKIASTYGTAVAGGAGNKIRAEITPNFNAETLTPRMIGSGLAWADSAVRGNFKPTISLAMDGGYRNCMDNIIAQCWGTSGAPSEVTGGQADYKHTITLNPSINAKYGTLAYEDSSATTMEFPSVACTSMTFTLDDAPGILDFSAEFIANTASLSSVTNTNATLAAATATDTEVIAYAFEDTFRMNSSSGGAVAGGDQKNITSLTLTLNRPQEIIGEIKGATGNGAPVASGLATGQLTVTMKELADHADYTIWTNETAQKAVLNIQGTQIGSGTNKTLAIYLPKLQLVQEPVYAVTADGTNTVSLTYEIIKAASNPTGMSSTYPYFEITNGLSTSLLA